MKIKFITLILLVLGSFYELKAQKDGQLHGNFQVDAQSYKTDSAIGAPEVPEKFLLNSYANLTYTQGNFKAGIRYEGYYNTLQGFDSRYDGSGIPYRFITYTSDKLEVTAGSYYEQFGSGLIFRSYEDKGLGYDNAMDGVRVKYNPIRGMYIKGIIGKQRLFFSTGPGIVRGIDGEIMLNEMFPKFSESKTQVILGGSFVSKYQADKDPVYNLPENVGAWAGRINITRGKVSLMSEYAYKINDPSADNDYIYKNGEALVINASYSQKGLGILVGAKRVDNMSFRSDRNAGLQVLNINYLPVITKTYTYAMASMYPYATQPNGEMGYQAEIMYKFKKESLLGGKYGTNVSLNYSRINSIERSAVDDTTLIGESGTLGYNSDFFAFGDEIYYQDLNLEINKKISKKLKAVFVFQNLIYNYDVLRGMTGHGKVYSNAGIADITYKISDNHAIRFEFEALFTQQDMGDWGMGLIEYSVAPHWFFTVMDQYNYGNEDSEKQLHYYTAGVTYADKGTRIALGYGRQREGILCVGGVCRNVPASNGFTLSISSSF